MKKRAIILAMGAVLMLSGCTSVIELSSEEEDIIAEYAAQTLVKSYKKSIGVKDEVVEEKETGNRGTNTGVGIPSIGYRVPQNNNSSSNGTQESTKESTEIATLPANEPTTSVGIPSTTLSSGEQVTTAATTTETSTNAEKPTTTEKATVATQANTTAGATGVTTPAGNTPSGTNNGAVGNTLEEALNISGVELSVIGYAVESHYPLETFSFTVDANPGHKLLIVEYDVWNSADADAVMGVDASRASIKAVINGTEKVNVYKTMLKNDLMNMNGSKFKPGEAKTGVLIFSIKDELAEKITSVDILSTLK